MIMYLGMKSQDVLELMKQLINNIYETTGWPKDFHYVTMITLKKNPKASTCSNHCTIRLITQRENIVARVLRRIKRETEDILREDQSGFRRGQGDPCTIGMLTIMSK
jgi:hypothetical protein